MVADIEESMEEDVFPSYASAATRKIINGKKAASKKSTNNPLIKEAIMGIFSDITEDSVQSVAHFITNKIEPKACTCGKAVAFNLASMMKAITLKNPNNTLSDSAIRTYIVEERIGCVGKSTKFIKEGKSTSSAHVNRALIPPEILEQLDRDSTRKHSDRAEEGSNKMPHWALADAEAMKDGLFCTEPRDLIDQYEQWLCPPLEQKRKYKRQILIRGRTRILLYKRGSTISGKTAKRIAEEGLDFNQLKDLRTRFNEKEQFTQCRRARSLTPMCSQKLDAYFLVLRMLL
ncbi:hypothetical protein ACROYT_G015214 [Oculina patagonica]